MKGSLIDLMEEIDNGDFNVYDTENVLKQINFITKKFHKASENFDNGYITDDQASTLRKIEKRLVPIIRNGYLNLKKVNEICPNFGDNLSLPFRLWFDEFQSKDYKGRVLDDTDSLGFTLDDDRYLAISTNVTDLTEIKNKPFMLHENEFLFNEKAEFCLNLDNANVNEVYGKMEKFIWHRPFIKREQVRFNEVGYISLEEMPQEAYKKIIAWLLTTAIQITLTLQLLNSGIGLCSNIGQPKYLLDSSLVFNTLD